MEKWNDRDDENRGGYSYEQDYEPAYRFGWEAHSRYADRQWEEVQAELQREWEQQRDSSKLTWNQAREACQDAWDHYLREAPASDLPGLEEQPPDPT